MRKIDDFRRRGRELMASGVMQVRKRAVRKIFGGGGSHTCKNSTVKLKSSREKGVRIF